MKALHFILPPSFFTHALRRRSQVVRQRSAKPLFIGSIPIAAFNNSLPFNNLRAAPGRPLHYVLIFAKNLYLTFSPRRAASANIC